MLFREGSGEVAANENIKNVVRAPNTEKKSAPNGKRDGDVGKALRSAYQQTVSEDVPQEMLDLLSKLA